MRYVRIYSDQNGKSHFEDISVELRLSDLAPPEPPVNTSAFTEATQFGFLSAPADWHGDWHPSPHSFLDQTTLADIQFGTSLSCASSKFDPNGYLEARHKD